MSIPFTAFRKASGRAALAAAAFLFVFTSAAASAADILASDKVVAPEALLPYLSWLADPQGEISMSDLSAGAVQERFTPLYKGIPLKNKGPVWFRLVMVSGRRDGGGAVPAQAGVRLSMNLGQLPPGGARLFYSESPGPVSAPGVWHSETIDSREETLLPETGLAPVSIFIRMEEMPGLWFSPVIGPQSAARAGLLPLDLLLPGITAAAAVACLLRLAADRALWALWAALYLACVLGQSSLPLPSPDRGFAPENLPALLAPGLALLILPHVGRCMFRTDKASMLKDGSLYFCSLLGAATAVLPLVPGFSWLTRLFPLSPLLLAPALPFCLSSMAAKRAGAPAFSGAVIMPVIGALLCLAALKYPDLHPAAAQGGLWGMAVGGLGLALAGVPRNAAGPGAEDQDKQGPAAPDMPGGLSAAFSVISPQSQYEELPTMAVTHIGGAGDAEQAGTPGSVAGPEDGRQGGDAPAGGKAGLLRISGNRREKTQDIPFLLPSGENRSYLDLPSEVMNILEGPVPTGNMQTGSYPFNLHTLVRQVHDIVSPLAESKGLIFSWYMSPSLPVLLEGDSPRLRGALILLLQSAVQAADGGAVQLAVRRNPMTSFEGDLLFSISDNGSAQRTDAGFFLAWELSSRTGGAFTVDYSATGGTRTAFNVRFKLLDAETAFDPAASALPSRGKAESAAPPPRIGGTRPLCILQAEMTGGSRRHTARCLEGVPHTVVNSFDEEQLVRLAGEHEPDLVIFDADTPENVIARCIADLRSDEGGKVRKRAAVLVLTGHDMQAARLLEAGADYVLGKPFTREAFLDALAAAVPSVAPRIRALGAATADRPDMSAQAVPSPERGVSSTDPTGSPAFGAAEDVAWETFTPLHEISPPHGNAGRTAAAGASGADAFAAHAGGGPQTPVPAPAAERYAPGPEGSGEADAVKLPIPARLIPKGMTPDAPVPASAPEPALLPASAAASAPAGTYEATFGEAEDSDAPKLPRPARLIPRGMAAERLEGESSTKTASPAGPFAADASNDPDSVLMPGQHLSRDPFLDPSVAFLRPTFTPPGRPPLREAVKLATGLETSGAVSDALEAPAQSAGHEAGLPRPASAVAAPATAPAGDGSGRSQTAGDAPATQANTGGGGGLAPARQSRSGQSPDVPMRRRGQSSGTVDAQTEQQTQAGPTRPGVRLQVQAQPAAAKRLSFSAGKGNEASGPARLVPTLAGAGRERPEASAHGARHVAERPGAVQVQLPPRHGIPRKGETDVSSAAGNATPQTRQPAGTPHGMPVSVHPSESPAGGTFSLRIPRPSRNSQDRAGQNPDETSAQTGRVRAAQVRDGVTRTSQAPAAQVRDGAAPSESAGSGAGLVGSGQAAASRGEEQTSLENAYNGVGSGAVQAVIGRAASDAAPMVMGLSPEDVVAPATAPAAAPFRRAEGGKRGLPGGEFLIDPDAVRTADRLEDAKQAGAGRGREEEKRTLPGSLIDFMLLDSAQDDDDDGDGGAATVTGRPGPPQTGNTAADKTEREVGATPGPRTKADAARSKAAPAVPQPPARNRTALRPAPKTPITNLSAALSVPLPGLDGEFLDPDALRFLPGLTESLADALRDAGKGVDENRPALVQEAAARMASKAEHFGLSRLGRLARCLERAAEARDEEAAATIMEDLRRASLQYEKALAECSRSLAGVDG
ncbi:MAG: hypothetical protein LBP38_03585 [Desulfovibrio sp.]|jgi:CheY-like chemotaxis protein|nr:hypothetical protein [Desulfovibrio sp.]